jgi:hypothetical protein
LTGKKHKKPSSTTLSNPSVPFILTEPHPIEISSGYSISIKYSKDGIPQIGVKKYGEVDMRWLRREIERTYPGAAIQGLEKSKLIKLKDKPEKESTPKAKTSDSNEKL